MKIIELANQLIDVIKIKGSFRQIKIMIKIDDKWVEQEIATTLLESDKILYITSPECVPLAAEMIKSQEKPPEPPSNVVSLQAYREKKRATRGK